MYWSASSWIWPSISVSLRLLGREIILVMTAEPETATAACLALVPALEMARRMA